MRWLDSLSDLVDLRRILLGIGILAIAAGVTGFTGRSSTSRPPKGIQAYDQDDSAGIKIFGRSGWFATVYAAPESDCLPCVVIMNDEHDAATLGLSVTAQGLPYLQVRDPADGSMYAIDLVKLAKQENSR